MAATSPAVAMTDLGQQLRRRREELGLTATMVARAGGCTTAFLGQVELGRKPPGAALLNALLDHLELIGPDRDTLVELRRTATQRGAFSGYSGIFGATQLRFFGLEEGAESSQAYSAGLVHGLLQTADYAAEVIRSGGAHVRQADVARRAEARLLRQRRLVDAADPLVLSVVMSEAALRQEVGGRDVLVDQLRHLVDLTAKLEPRLELRIIPFRSSGHPMLGTPPFDVLTFPTPRLPNIACFDTVTGMHLVDDPAAVHEHQLAYQAARAAALSGIDSLHLITETAQELT